MDVSLVRYFAEVRINLHAFEKSDLGRSSLIR